LSDLFIALEADFFSSSCCKVMPAGKARGVLYGAHDTGRAIHQN
jgi:hypothetical protein